ncbi:MAG: SDR family NAD(P)-dependent oxidoreductase, partial [Paracraurococcus sp.]
MTQIALDPGSVAVITGGASGIGLAAARRWAEMGLRICIADRGGERLEAAAEALAALAPGGRDGVLAAAVDVSRAEEVAALEARVRERFGGTDVLMNNAGIQPGSDLPGS